MASVYTHSRVFWQQPAKTLSYSMQRRLRSISWWLGLRFGRADGSPRGRREPSLPQALRLPRSRIRTGAALVQLPRLRVSAQRLRPGVRCACLARPHGQLSAKPARFLQGRLAMLALWDWFLRTYRRSRRTGATRLSGRALPRRSRSARYGALTWCAHVQPSFASSTSAAMQASQGPFMFWCLIAICAWPPTT